MITARQHYPDDAEVFDLHSDFPFSCFPKQGFRCYGNPYLELGEDSFTKREQQTVQLHLMRRLESLGLKVTVEPASQAA